MIAEMVQEVKGLREEVKAAVAPKKTEVPVPSISIIPEAQQWQPNYEEGTKRCTCPLKEQDLKCGFDLTDFESWLKTNGAQKRSTINGNLLSVRRLVTLLDISQEILGLALAWSSFAFSFPPPSSPLPPPFHPHQNHLFQEAQGEWHDIAGFLIGLYEQNIIPELMKVPLMDIKYTWARNMLQGSLFVFSFLPPSPSLSLPTLSQKSLQKHDPRTGPPCHICRPAVQQKTCHHIQEPGAGTER